MSFKTEMHLHSYPVSCCASITNKEIIKKYTEAGYSTVVLTNHINSATFNQQRFPHPDYEWDKKIDFFVSGYKELKKAAKGKLNVILGLELALAGAINDYLIYGVTEEFLRANPNLSKLDEYKLSTLCKENALLLYQAHPFRNGMKVIDPCLLFGVEVSNGNLHHDSRNEFAEEWADHFGLHKVSGSDMHHGRFAANGGIITEKEITSNEDLLEVLKTDNYTLIRR